MRSMLLVIQERERERSLSQDTHGLVRKREMRSESKSGRWSNPNPTLSLQSDGGGFPARELVASGEDGISGVEEDVQGVGAAYGSEDMQKVLENDKWNVSLDR